MDRTHMNNEMNNQAAQTMPLQAPNKIAHDLLIDLRAAAAIGRPITGDEIHEIEQRMIAALSQPAGVAEGWKLVPVEPTEEMLKAGWRFYGRAAYESMVEAAPPVPAAPAASGGERTIQQRGLADPNPYKASESPLLTNPEWGVQLNLPAGASVSERVAVSALVSAAREIDRQAWGNGTSTITASQVKALGFARESVERALSSPRQEGEVLARGWFHALPDDDDYEFHDDASGAGKNCGGCIRAMIVTEGSAAASPQRLRELVQRWREESARQYEQHRRQAGYEVDFSHQARSDPLDTCADELEARCKGSGHA
jgi:hypothetical protein